MRQCPIWWRPKADHLGLQHKANDRQHATDRLTAAASLTANFGDVSLWPRLEEQLLSASEGFAAAPSRRPVRYFLFPVSTDRTD
jgi:hypothetical protein